MLKKSNLLFTGLMAALLAGCAMSEGNAPSVILPQLDKNKQTYAQPAAEPTQNEHLQSAHLKSLTEKSVAGVWQAKIGEMQCQLSTSRTKSGKGFRAAAMLCPVSFAHVKYWRIENGRLLFYNTRDQVIADLSIDQNGELKGLTEDKEPITLWR